MNLETLKKISNKPLIAAHRGLCAGNIPFNTLASYELAIKAGSEVIELDVAKSRDKELFCFHPGMEEVMFEEPTPIADMDAAEVRKRHITNGDNTPTQFVPPLFDEALELLKGRAIIAVDKFWIAVPEISKAIRAHNMTDQVMCKVLDNEKGFDMVESLAPDMPILPILHKEDKFTKSLLKRNLSLCGIEAIFTDDKDPIASEEYVDFLHKNNLFVWVNSIVYDYKKVLTGGHTDDVAMMGDKDEGWGWLIDRGFDVIQTDWIRELRDYIDSKN